jgi:hypothetical protein
MKAITAMKATTAIQTAMPAIKHYEKYWCMTHRGLHYTWTCKISIKDGYLIEKWTCWLHGVAIMKAMKAMKAMNAKK